MYDYARGIKKTFGFFPHTLGGQDFRALKDDFNEVKKKYTPLIDQKKDAIVRSSVIGWAERAFIDTNTIDYARWTCPLLHRIEKEAFIAPDGAWYLCCLDSKAELQLGNLNETSLDEIYIGKKRNQLISMLEHRQFNAIGGSCRTVNACQQIYPSVWAKLYHQLQKVRQLLGQER
jgi:radical SAM protein with 4Fe4S-binding SPASM domain